jgi:excisionase family DNA binding protein
MQAHHVAIPREEIFGRQRVNTVKAAEIAGVTKRTIYNWMVAGRIEFVRTPTGNVRIYVDTLLREGRA